MSSILNKDFLQNNSATLFFIYLLIVVLFGNNWVTLWDQDEAAYAGFAKNMLDSGNYLTPNYTWSEIHRKTPLHFWAIAMSYKIFGVNEFAVRFPAAISIWGTVLCIYTLGKKVFGKKESLIGSIIISTSFLVMSLAKISVTDAGILFYSTLCGFSIVHILLFRKKIFVLIFWVSFGLAVLLKGPPIIIFTFLFILVLFILHPQRKNLLILHPWFFLPISLVPFAYWVFLCTQTIEGNKFVLWLADWYILKRIGGSVLGQSGPPGTHLIILLLVFANYLAWIPGSLLDTIKNSWKNKNSVDFILISWFVCGWLIYEFTPSKLPSYIIAAHTPFAIIIARHHLTRSKKIAVVPKLFHTFINSIILIAFVAAPFVIEFNTITKYLLISLGTGFLIFFLYINFSRKKNKPLKQEKTEANPNKIYFERTLVFNIVFHFVIWTIILPAVNEIKNSTYRVAQYIAENSNSETVVIIANNSAHPPSLPFYLNKQFKTVYEEYDYAKLRMMYESETPTAIILNKKLLQKFQENNYGIEYEEIVQIKSDQIKQRSYYVIINKKNGN